MSTPQCYRSLCSVSQQHRRGVALIMAIVILAALLMLGLPFLISQSSSQVGSRTFRDAQQAELGVDTATRLAANIASDIVAEHLKPRSANDPAPKPGTPPTVSGLADRFDSHSLEKTWETLHPNDSKRARFVDDKDLRTNSNVHKDVPLDVMPVGRFTYVQFDELMPNDFSRTPDKDLAATKPNSTLIGAIIEDESGKMNPNTMSVAAWDGLLKGVFGTWETDPNGFVHQEVKNKLNSITPKLSAQKIDELSTFCELFYDVLPSIGNDHLAYRTDWDDNQALHGRLNLRVQRFPNKYSVNEDTDHFGQLAEALARLPAQMPDGRITDLEQLLLADTDFCSDKNNSVTNSKDDHWPKSQWLPFGLRRPLTRSELERLRPYLSLHNAAPGREGLIDLGTILYNEPDGISCTIFDIPLWADRIYGLGASMRFKNSGSSTETTSSKKMAAILMTQNAWWDNFINHSWYCDWGSIRRSDETVARDSAAVALVAQPPINFFTAARPVLRAIHATRLESIPGNAEAGLDALISKDEKSNAFPIDLFKNIAAGWDRYIPPTPARIFAPANESFHTLPVGHPLSLWNLRDTRITSERAVYRHYDNRTDQWIYNHSFDVPVSLPPLGWSSQGTIAVTSITNTTDALGRQVASRQRRSIVQAIPQERPIERRWTTQMEMDDIIGQQFANGIQTWPNPVDRLWQDLNLARSWSDATTINNGTIFNIDLPSFRPAPLPGLATGYRFRHQRWAAWRTPMHLRPGAFDDATNLFPSKDTVTPASPLLPNIDWAVDFGAAAPLRTNTPDPTTASASSSAPQEDPTWPKPFLTGDGDAQTLDQRAASSAAVPLIKNTASFSWTDRLVPDGLRLLASGPALAYPIIDQDASAAAPAQAPTTPAPGGKEEDIKSAIDLSVPHGIVRRADRVVQIFADEDDDKGASIPSREMGNRHIAVWVKPESDWAGSSIITLLESRIPVKNAGGEIQVEDPTKISVSNSSEDSPNPISPEGIPEATGNNSLQNLLSLSYDSAHELLVLTIAPPTIPHTRDSGPVIPWDNPDTPDLDERSGIFITSTNSILPRSLAPRPYSDWDSAKGTSSKLGALSTLIKPNVVSTLLNLRTSTGSKYFTKGRWTHVQIVLGSSRPGGVAIIVDGIPGHTIQFGTAAPGSSVPVKNGNIQLLKFGDQCTLPALPLAKPLLSSISQNPDADSIESATSLTQLKVPTIEVLGLTCNGATISAEHLYPKRGMIRIDDEYILYESVSGNTFKDCIRAQRQNSDTNNANQILRWPRIQNHVTGSLVVPSSFRIDCAGTHTATLYKGGCKLQDEFPNGDPVTKSLSGSTLPTNPYAFCIWAALPSTATAPIVPSILFPNKLVLFDTVSDVIPLDGTLGVPDQFPPKGIVRIQERFVVKYTETNKLENRMYSRYYSYSGKAKNQLTGVKLLSNEWTFWPDKSFSDKNGVYDSNMRHEYDPKDYEERAVFLVSLRLQPGVDPSEKGRYRHTEDWTDEKYIIQLMDPKTGHAEWIRYSAIAKDPEGNFYFVTKAENTGETFFENNISTAIYRFGSWRFAIDLNVPSAPLIGTRGTMRTDFYGRPTAGESVHQLAGSKKGPPLKLSTTLSADTVFPIDSLVIPVQTEFDKRGIGHCLATGDVVTFMPKQLTRNGATENPGMPTQAIIRYAAMDGYTVNDADQSQINDVKNEYFAFAHFLPQAITIGGNYEIICGNGWSCSQDLTAPENSPLHADTLLSFALPRLDLFSDDLTLPTPKDQKLNMPLDSTNAARARVIIGDTDRERMATGNGIVLPKAVDMTIDGLVAGALPAACGNPSIRGTITAWKTNEDKIFPGLKDTSLTELPCFVEFPLPETPTIFPSNTGLIQIGGEIFAWIQNKGKLRLIARGLLGSPRTPHIVDEPFLILPLGPVALLDGTLGEAPDSFILEDGANDCASIAHTSAHKHSLGISVFDAPAALICSPDGQKSEIVSLFGTSPHYVNKCNTYERHFHTASWCRGLYNTPIGSWSGEAQFYNDPPAQNGAPKVNYKLQPVLIGWWPRYPSAMPNTTPANPAAMLRSRVYSWIGFPHSMNSGWFAPKLFKSLPIATDQTIAEVSLLDTGPACSSLLTVKAMAMAKGFDWTIARSKTLVTGTNDLTSLFDDTQFEGATNGAELRVYWQYKKPTNSGSDPMQTLTDAAEAGSVAPALGSARLRCLAPARVLATERP